MNELESKLSAVRRRLLAQRFIDWACKLLLAALVAGVGGLFLLRLVPMPVNAWEMLGVAVALAVVAAGIAALAKPVSLYRAALTADESLGLRERLSSALLLRAADDPMGAIEALRLDAGRHSAAIQPRRDFPFRAPRVARHLAWPALAFLAMYFLMPQFDLFRKEEAKKEEKTNEAQSQRETMRKSAAREIQELAKKAKTEKGGITTEAGVFAQNLERLSRDVALGTKDEKLAVAEMSRMQDQVRLEKNELERKMEPFKSLKGLQEAKQTREMQQDIKAGRFDRASSQAERMADSMNNPASGSAGQKEQLAEELKQMANQLGQNKEMAAALSKAADAMQKAAEEAKKEEEKKSAAAEQKEGGDDKGDGEKQGGEKQGGQEQQQGGEQQQGENGKQGSQGKEGSQGDQTGQGEPQSGQSQAAQGAQSGGAQADAAQAMKDLAKTMEQQQGAMEQMAQLDALQQQLGLTQQSLLNQQCQGQSGGEKGKGQGQAGKQGQGGQQGGQQSGGQQGENGQGQGMQASRGKGGEGNSRQGGTGEWESGQSKGRGPGSGGPGQGKGERPDAGNVDVTFQDVLVPGQQNDGGEIIATIEIDAPAPRGQSNIKYSTIYNNYQQKAADTMRNDVIPMGYRNQVQGYFDAINPQGKAAGDGKNGK